MVSRRASESLRRDHLWVYASDVEQVEPGPGNPPALIPVVDNRGIPLGTALYSPISQIALRLISRELITQPQWLAQLAERLHVAIHRRKPLLDPETNACRLVFSEADNLPGLIIDKYASVVILQLLAKGLDNPETRNTCVEVLREELGHEPLTIWERPDPRIRELEGLSAPATTPLFSNHPEAPQSSTQFRLNGLGFHFDANSGQKTGAFLDQRQNYAAAATWAKALGLKKALDVCTYQGGFALHLAQVCEQVTGIDASRASLEVAERNLELNRKPGAPGLASETWAREVDWVEADAFEILRAWSESKSPDTAEWDVIVLDPPAFAKSKRAVEGALRGYKELNLRALHMIRPGGLLVTCSCSHHVSWSDLESAVASAAVDAHRRVTLLERRGAAQDHPVLLNLPETEYLKCLICQVD
jgi:23S rRNA (cytosine1962-C5)-methyltransferase